MITQLDIVELRAEIDAPFSASVSRGRHTHRGAVLVRVVNEDGIEGWGETFQALSGPQSALVSVLRDLLGPLVIGRSELETLDLWRSARRAGRGYGDLLSRAYSAIDTAVWDLKGRVLGQSVSTMLGAGTTGRFPAVATAIFYGDPVDDLGFRKEATQRQVDAGYPGIKLKIGGVDPRTDLAHVDELRALVPDDVMMAVDANSGCTGRTTAVYARALQDMGIYWLEEPTALTDLDAYRRLADTTSLVIAGGQDLPDAEAFAPYLREGLLHLIQPSIAAAGGVTGVVRAVQAAAVMGARYCPTGWGTGLLVAASLHVRNAFRGDLALPVPDLDWIEYDVSPNPLMSDLLATPVVPVDGWLTVPEGPGLGVELDRDAVEKFTVQRVQVEG